MADPLALLFGDPVGIMIFAVIVIMPVTLSIIMFVLSGTGQKKALIMYYDTEQIVRFFQKKVHEGKIIIGKKIISVDTVRPALVRVGGIRKGYRPLFIIRWNKALPSEHRKDGIEVMSGENLKHLTENKTLEKLLQPRELGKMSLLYMLMGVLIGGLAGYIIAGALAGG